MADKIKVLNSLIKTLNSQPYLECQIDDGSLWTCTPQGTNWQKIKLSNAELTELLFNAQQSKPVPYKDS